MPPHWEVRILTAQRASRNVKSSTTRKSGIGMACDLSVTMCRMTEKTDIRRQFEARTEFGTPQKLHRAAHGTMVHIQEEARIRSTLAWRGRYAVHRVARRVVWRSRTNGSCSTLLSCHGRSKDHG